MFRDREDAGSRLADALESLKGERDVVVLAIPRGGIVVAKEIAASLDAPLDLIVVRKIGAPSNPEYAIGAVSQDGDPVLDLPAVRSLGISERYLSEQAAKESAEVRRRLKEYRGDSPYPALEGKTVVIVDDGMATGETALAAVLSAKKRGAARVVMAVPVASREAVGRVAAAADRVVCLETPSSFYAVGEFYGDFPQVSDEAVKAVLGARARRGGLG